MEPEKGSESLSFNDSNELIRSKYENKILKNENNDQDKFFFSNENKIEIYNINKNLESQANSDFPLLVTSNSDQNLNSKINFFEKSTNSIKANSKETLSNSKEASISNKDQKKGLFSYKRDYSGTDSIDMFFRYNPNNTEKELADMLDSNETKQCIDPAMEDEEKTILNIISEFYHNKKDNYKICICKYCKVLTLPFLLARSIEDSKKIEELERKHKEYYVNCMQKLGISSINQALLIPINNIFMKKVNLNQVRITSVFDQISKSNNVT